MSSLAFAAKLRSIQADLAQEVAEKSASSLTELAKAQYNGGVRTGDTLSSLRIVPSDGGLKGIVSTPYAKFLKGVFPKGLPSDRKAVLDGATASVMAQKLGGA